MTNKIIGKFGESIATDYLKRQGYKIIANNYQAGHQEIDVIACMDQTLVFIEVKTRTTQFYGEGLEACGYFKQRALRAGINIFLSREDVFYMDVRADLITVYVNKIKQCVKIKHYENVL